MRHYLLTLVIALLLLLPGTSLAGATLTPAVIDLQGEARDILRGSVTLTNTFDHKVVFYPVVENIDQQTGRTIFVDPSRADFSTSLANWIEISRGGIELEAGESRTISFDVRVNLTARPGRYHATIAFPDGGNRPEAEGRLAGAAATTVNLELTEYIAEQLNIIRFAPTRRFFSGLPAEFVLEVQNTGDRPEALSGDLILYDRAGKEVATLRVNDEGRTIAKDATEVFRVRWSDGRPTLGQYKASIFLRYGASLGSEAQDVAFFWILPWMIVALAAIVFLGGVFALAWYFHLRYGRYHAAHLSPRGVGVAPIAPPVGHAYFSGQTPHVVDLRHPEKRI